MANNRMRMEEVPSALKLSDRLREPRPVGAQTERAGAVRDAAPAAVELSQTSTPRWEGEAAALF